MKGGILGPQCSGAISGAFPGGWGRIPDNPLTAASVAALFGGGPGARALAGGWSSDPEGRLTFRRVAEDGLRIVVSLDPDAVLASEGSAGLAGQWSYVERMSPLTVDVLLAVLAQFCAPCTANNARFRLPALLSITARAILGYKQLRRWGAEGAALRRRIDQEIVRLQGLRFDVRPVSSCDPGRRRRNTRDLSVCGDRLFEIVDSTTVRAARKGSPVRSETVWTIGAGQWARWWMNAEAGARFGRVPQLVLEFDHRRNRGSAVLAKKIGLGTMVLWGRERPRASLDRAIGELLEDIGELPTRDGRGGRWGARMRDRFGRAVLMLQDTGLIGRVGWPAGFEPGRADFGKGWVDAWLAGRIVLDRREAAECAGVVGTAYPGTTRHARMARCDLTELRRGPVIRAMRLERNISQRRLADDLGISAAYLSQVENQRRMASRAVLERIAGWVRSNGVPGRGVQQSPAAVATIESVAGEWQTAKGSERLVAGGGFARPPGAGSPVGKDDRT